MAAKKKKKRIWQLDTFHHYPYFVIVNKFNRRFKKKNSPSKLQLNIPVCVCRSINIIRANLKVMGITKSFKRICSLSEFNTDTKKKKKGSFNSDRKIKIAW